MYFDRTGNIRPVLMGYHPDWRLFILWDADLHDLGDGFPYSKNVQAPPDIVWGALARGLDLGSRRLKKPPITETIVAARPLYLAEALEVPSGQATGRSVGGSSDAQGPWQSPHGVHERCR